MRYGTLWVMYAYQSNTASDQVYALHQSGRLTLWESLGSSKWDLSGISGESNMDTVPLAFH